jgi:prepilin-type N-terminal cleavage/methylation domain-containing protein
MNDRRSIRAFTLIEMLTVIAIIGVIAAIMMPTLKNFRQNDATQGATRQLLDAVARARQLAISQRTTVYLVFVPTNFWVSPANLSSPALSFADRLAATNLADKQLTAYNFVALRSVGDQPGQGFPRYLSTWETLPPSTFIAFDKFNIPRFNKPGTDWYMTNLYTLSSNKVFGFQTATNIPFPLATTQPWRSGGYPLLPYIGFDYLGRVISGEDEFIPLSKGGINYAKGTNGLPLLLVNGPSPSVVEAPPGNTTNSYNIVHIDWLTGRARLERQEVR